jgi:DNA-binding MarR family transcriptional regulator
MPNPGRRTDRLDAAALLGAMIGTLRRLRRVDRAAGHSGPRLSALSVLAFAGPLSLSRLAAAEQVSLPSASRLVRELERAGLVRRSADPTDARAIVLAVTAKGRELMQRGRARRVEALEAAATRLAPAERAALARSVSALSALAGQLGGASGAPARARLPKRVTAR